MSDILERLRDNYRTGWTPAMLVATCDDAAKEIERLQAELREAQEHSQAVFMEATLLKGRAESAESLLAARDMQMAELVGEMKAIAVNRDDPILLGEITKALSNLPDVSKYRRLMEAVEEFLAAEITADSFMDGTTPWDDEKHGEAVTRIQETFKKLKEAFRAIKP